MKRKPHSTSLVLLLLCIFTFWWGISVLAQHDTSQPATNAPLLVHESIDADTYTFAGTYQPINSCDSFGSGIQYNANGGGHVSVLLITESSSNCTQAASVDPAEPFSVSITLPPGSNPNFDGVLLNGTDIPSQLVSAQ